MPRLRHLPVERTRACAASAKPTFNKLLSRFFGTLLFACNKSEFIILVAYSPNGDEFAESQRDSIHLRDETGRNRHK